MPIRKEAAYIGLVENSNIRYDIIDRSATSENYFQVTEFPETLTAGKNVFKFRGDPDSLVDDSRVHIEILDYNGDPIYYEVLNYQEKDGTRVIAVYVYDDTPEGRCTFYLGARALIDVRSGRRLPFSADSANVNWKDLPNVLWLRESRVAPKRRNDNEIILLQQPKVTIEEKVKTFSEITDLPTFFKVVNGDGASIKVSGTGPGAGYTTITQPVSPIGPQIAPFLEGSLSRNTPARGNASIAVAMPSSFANSPAVIGNSSAQNANAVATSTGLSTAAVNNATAGVGLTGPGGTTTTTLAPISPTFASPSTATTATTANVNDSRTVEDTAVTSIQTIVFNPPDTTTITVTGFPLTASHHLGATVVINNPKITAPSDAHLNNKGRVVHHTSTHVSTGGGNRRVDSTYVGTIVEVENSTTAKLHPPFNYKIGRQSKSEGEHVVDFNNSAFTMSYWVPQMSQDTENSMSFANIILNNIEPATGDIFSVKTSYKLMGAPGDYIDAGNTILEQQDALIDKTDSSPDIILGVKDTSMGEFPSQDRINRYWNVTNGTATFDNDVSGESVLLEGDIDNNTDSIIFSLKDFYSPTLYKDTEYQLLFFTKGLDSGSMNPVNTSVNDLRLDVYISGSAGESSTMRETKEYRGGILGAPVEGSAPALTDISLGQYLGTVEYEAGAQNIANIVQFVPEDTDNYVLKFVVRKGKTFIKNIQLSANVETGFSPNTAEMNIRIPTDKMNAPLAFKFQYLDYLGAPAEVETFAQGAIFDGDNTYIEGEGNLLSGSVFIGNTVGSGIEMAGVSSGFIRSIGYQGFSSASAGKGAGFLMFSGSVLPDSPDNYAGVGLELVQDSSSFFKYRTNPAQLEIRTNTFFLGSDDNFVSGANGLIEISSSNFHLANDGDVVLQGTITAEAGGTIGGFAIGSSSLSVGDVFRISSSQDNTDPGSFISSSGFKVSAGGDITGSSVLFTGGKIGGFTIGSDNLTGTDFILNTTNKRLTLGNSNDIFIADADEGIFLGAPTFDDAPFSVDLTGLLKAESGTIAGWSINAVSIKRSTTNGAVTIDSGAQLISISSGSSAANSKIIEIGRLNSTQFGIIGYNTTGTEIFKLGETGNVIAGWTFDDKKLSNTGVHLSASYGLKIFDSSNENTSFVEMKYIGNSDYGLLGKENGVNIFQLGSTNQIAGWTIDSQKLANTGVHLSASYGVKAFDASNDNTEFVELKYRANDNFGLIGTSGGNTIFSLGKNTIAGVADNQIAGWEFDNEKLQGGSMIIRKDGTIESDGFASNLAGSGFRLTAAQGGFLEVENARIRGTLSTATFEKETVNAVGGQLYVANSTTLTSSAIAPQGIHSESMATMSVVNVSGFSAGEILTAKKISSTGFATEYILVDSASRTDSSSETDLSGLLFVQRGYSGSTPTTGQVSSSLGDLASNAQSYSGSQVIVSTGKLGTGYIRLNANPNDPTTPYIDIVERTGSAIYDIDLKARLGDLSGITDTSFSDDVTGFGLYTQNGYFKGKIEIGSQPSQAPNDKLFLHYNFQGSTNNKIISQTPSAFTASFSNATHLNLGVPGAATINTVVPTQTELQGPLSVNANEFTSSLPAGQNAFSAGFRLSFASESLDKNTFITRNYPRFVVYKQTNDRIQLRIYSGSTDNDTTYLEAVSFDTGVDDVIKENDLYHIFITAKENHSASIDIYNVTSGSYAGGAAVPLEFANNGGDHTFGWPAVFDAASYVEWEHGAPGWNTGDNKAFHGTWHDIRYYKDTVLTNSQMEAIVTNTDAASGGTIIDGDSIQTGKIKSNNFGASVGSELDLDAGTIKLGGSANPLFSVDATGHVSASAGSIAGLQISTDSISRPGIFEISSSQDTTDPVSFISSSAFKVSADGRMTGSNFLFSGGKITSDVTILGSVSATSILTPATIGGSPATIQNASSSIDAGGFASFKSASIAGFVIDENNIFQLTSGTPNNAPTDGLVISGSGGPNSRPVINVFDGTTRIAALGNFQSGKDGIFAQDGTIGGWDIDSGQLDSGASNIQLSATNKRITINSSTFGNSGIQLEYNSGTPRFHVGDPSGKFIQFDGTNITMDAGNFSLDSSGNITATNVDLSGDISATTGDIGGFTIASSTISAGTSGTAQIELDSSTPKITIGNPSGEHIDLTSGQLRFHNTGATEVFRFNSSILGGQERSAQTPGATCGSGGVSTPPSLSGMEMFSKTTGLFFATPPATTDDVRNIDFTPGRFFMEGGKLHKASSTHAESMLVARFFDCTIGNNTPDVTGTSGAIYGKYQSNNVATIGTKYGVRGTADIDSSNGTGTKMAIGVKGEAGGSGNSGGAFTKFGVHSTGNIKGTGNIKASSDIVAYSSDGRLKENIVTISHPLEKIKQLRGVIYDWKEEVYEMGFTPSGDGKQEMGMIAQEVQKVIPGAVVPAPFDVPLMEGPDGEYWDGNPKHNPDDPYLTVKYERVVPLLVQSIIEQQSLIEDMQERIKKLENK